MRVASTCVSIAPHGTFYMEGYVHPIRMEPAVGIHDDPKAVLLLLEEDGKEVLFVSLDVCIVSAEGTRLLREGLSASLGLPGEHIVISSIHSHSCASGFEGSNGLTDRTSHGYVAMASGRAIEASTGLRAGLVEVRPEIARTHVRGWYSNRNDKDCPFDDEAFVLRFVAGDEHVAGAMLNFNCHATVVGPLNRLLTTDIIGGVRAEVAEWVGCVPYTFTGASADLGNRQYRQGNDFAELCRVSNGVAKEIMKASFETVELAKPMVRIFEHDVHYNNEDFYAEYRRQLAEVERVLAGNPSFDQQKLADTERQCLMAQFHVHEVNFSIRMVLIDLGEVVLVTFPGELASELGIRVKSMFHGRVPEIIGYANDYQGYFVPECDFGGTSYESYVTKMPKGWIEDVLEEFRSWL